MHISEHTLYGNIGIHKNREKVLTAIKYPTIPLRLIEPLKYFETNYWRFRQTYFFENH